MAEQPRKIKKYRKPLNLNIGMLIFGAIFIYVIICVILYFQTDHIVRYEVTEGSLATNNIYRGVSIRTEEVVSTDTAGYVNFYAREGERVAKGDTVYIVDETGRLTEELEDASLGENTLSDQELSEFRNEIVNFMHGYDDKNYESTYDFKYSLKNTVLKLANVNMLQSIENGNNGSAANIVNFCYAPTTGIVAYWTDGYENLTVEGVTQEVFDNKNYEKKQMLGNELMAVGDPVYKLSTEENWSVVIPIDAERGAEIQQEDYVKVRFLKNQYESWGQAKLFTGSDGNTFLSLTFTNSMVTFVSDRFLDIELILNDETGLKIPNSSIVEKDYKTNEVLMMAYMNEEAFEHTLKSGKMTYYSRSRQCRWVKGETSGHYQYVKALSADCDNDTLLAKVEQIGAACHTGNHTCFYRQIVGNEYDSKNPLQVFESVYATIADRKQHPKEGSYTNYLFDKGIDKILKKVGEEATEIVIAAKNPNPEEIKYEISDFLYHAMVLMVERGVTWEDIVKELADR